ncbi:MAG: hypothetical protein N5P05_003647 [Chroococcopsis gigantea SAG 12.99]|jgi:hypothetical protein|nr:hypothetical protein [Chroococcopsis gigantea SAG 12.99]
MESVNITTIIVPRGAEAKAINRGLQRISGYKPIVLPIPIGSSGLDKWFQESQLSKDFLNKTLLMGLAGSLSSAHSVGDVVIYKGCGDGENKYLECDGEMVKFLSTILKCGQVKGLTKNVIVAKADKKTELGKMSGMDVVDMEGLRVLEKLRGVGMVRVISDGVDQDLPDIGGAIDLDGNLRPVRLAWEMTKNPFAAWHLIKGSLRGLRVLENVTYKLFACVQDKKSV